MQTDLGTEHTCSKLLDNYSKTGYIGTRDYSQCFDHVRPSPNQSAVLPLAAANSMDDMEQPYHADAANSVPCGILEGDPLSPVALTILMSASKITGFGV